MQYSFCNLLINIQNDPSMYLLNYKPFYENSEKAADITYSCKEEEIELPSKEPIFKDITGISVYENDNGTFSRYYFTINNQLRCRTTQAMDGTYELSYQINNNYHFSALELLNSLGLDGHISKKGRFILHSSFIKTKYGAVLFTAPCQTGKSTQASLWNTYRGAEIINGDRSGLWKEEGTFMAGGVLWSGTSGIMKNEILPLAAIVLLKQGPENVINPVRMVSKIARLMEQITINDWDREMYDSALEFCIDLCSNVPVYELSCRPDEGAVEVLEKELETL